MLGRFWLGAILPMLFVVPYRIPTVWLTKRFVVVEPWTLPNRSHTFRWLAGHRTHAPLSGSLHAHVYFIAEAPKGTSTRTELNMTSGSSANWPGGQRYLSVLNTVLLLNFATQYDHINQTRFPRCHPVPLTSCPLAGF